MKEMMKISQNKKTKDQTDLIMLLFGTKEQKEEALEYIKKQELIEIIKEKWNFEDAKRGKPSYITENY